MPTASSWAGVGFVPNFLLRAGICSGLSSAGLVHAMSTAVTSVAQLPCRVQDSIASLQPSITSGSYILPAPSSTTTTESLEKGQSILGYYTWDEHPAVSKPLILGQL